MAAGEPDIFANNHKHGYLLSPVLFLCFNRPLADWIETNLNAENIVITTFHGLTGMAVNWADLSGMRQGDFYARGRRLPARQRRPYTDRRPHPHAQEKHLGGQRAAGQPHPDVGYGRR
jgi:hypothetical protein